MAIDTYVLSAPAKKLSEFRNLHVARKSVEPKTGMGFAFFPSYVFFLSVMEYGL